MTQKYVVKVTGRLGDPHRLAQRMAALLARIRDPRL